jgi:large subunit ribosomal protein L13
VIDATDHVAGRLSSQVAKLLIKGNRVSVINCDKIMISGTRSNIISEYREFLEINSINHWKHGPKHPRRPDTIMKKMIRGMLPKEKPSGKEAHKRLRTYIGSPKEVKSLKKIKFEKAMIRKASSNYTTMADLGRTVGWTE